MIGMALVELESVGCVLDVDTATVYPLYENGAINFEGEVSLYDDKLPMDWIASLSDKDRAVIEKYVDLEGR